MSQEGIIAGGSNRPDLVKRGRYLEYFTIGYNSLGSAEFTNELQTAGVMSPHKPHNRSRKNLDFVICLRFVKGLDSMRDNRLTHRNEDVVSVASARGKAPYTARALIERFKLLRAIVEKCLPTRLS